MTEPTLPEQPNPVAQTPPSAVATQRGFWKGAAAGSIVVGTVASLIGIYQFAFPKGPSLEVAADYDQFVMPIGLPKQGQLYLMAEGENPALHPTLHFLGNLKSYVKLELTNSGDQPVKNLTLLCKGKGFVKVESNGKEDTAEFEDSYKLGDVAQDAKINLQLWTVAELSGWFKERIQLNHDDDKTTAAMPAKVFGFHAWVVHRSAWIVGVVLVGVMILLVYLRLKYLPPPREWRT